jgi:hypothetical protein
MFQISKSEKNKRKVNENPSPLSHHITEESHREIRLCPIQGVFHVLLRTRLSRGPLIFAPPPPPPPFPSDKLKRRHTGIPRKRDNLLTGEGRGKEQKKAWSSTVRHVTGNDQDYLRKIPRVVVQISALL